MYHVSFNRDVCKGCELCVSICPKHILGLENNPNIKGYMPAYCTDESSCVGCASCAKICPDSVITILEDE